MKRFFLLAAAAILVGVMATSCHFLQDGTDTRYTSYSGSEMGRVELGVFYADAGISMIFPDAPETADLQTPRRVVVSYQTDGSMQGPHYVATLQALGETITVVPEAVDDPAALDLEEGLLSVESAWFAAGYLNLSAQVLLQEGADLAPEDFVFAWRIGDGCVQARLRRALDADPAASPTPRRVFLCVPLQTICQRWEAAVHTWEQTDIEAVPGVIPFFLSWYWGDGDTPAQATFHTVQGTCTYDPEEDR